jgi:uncharacterized membrane protein
MTFCIALLLDFLATYPGSPNTLTACAVAVGTPLLVGFSRLYNGDHSMDQILYGWLLGVWLAIFNHSFVRDGIMQHVDNLVYKKVPYSQQALANFFWWASIIFFVLIGAMLYTFSVVNLTFTIPIEWQTRLE